MSERIVNHSRSRRNSYKIQDAFLSEKYFLLEYKKALLFIADER